MCASPATLSPDTAAGAARRANNFDALRFVMATVVVFSHSFPLAGYMTDKPLHRHGQDGSLGDMAVGGFFVLSGFLIGQSWDRRRGFWAFARRRALRVYPGFVAAAAVCAFAVPAVLGLDVGWESVRRFLSCVPRLWDPSDPTAFASNPYPNATNGSLWTIPYEFRCYLVVAALGAAGLLASARFLVAAFLSLVVLAAVSRGWAAPFPYNHVVLDPHQLFRLTAYFMVGALAHRWRDRLPWTNRGAVLAAAAMLAAVLVRPAWNLLMPLAVGYLAFWFAFHPRVKLHGFARRGDFTYGIYLYAFPIQQSVVYVAGGPVSPLTLFAVAWPLSVVAGALSWHLVERPFLPAARRRRGAAAAAAALAPTAEPASRFGLSTDRRSRDRQGAGEAEVAGPRQWVRSTPPLPDGRGSSQTEVGAGVPRDPPADPDADAAQPVPVAAHPAVPAFVATP